MGLVPVEPDPSLWAIEPPPDDHPDDLWAVGADLAPGTLLRAYRLGLFPMPLEGIGLAWFSPRHRGVIPLDRRPRRTLRRAAPGFEIRVDTCFADVVTACGDPRRPHGWIDGEIVEAYEALHLLGWAHSVETWDDDGLAGGLYGVAIGGLFAAESMFRRRPRADKAALHALIELLHTTPDPGGRLLDVQWPTPHLRLLGAVELSRATYRQRLEQALRLDEPSL
jgi:leucyl/phenylalanyl-tRNA--protein transferase